MAPPATAGLTTAAPSGKQYTVAALVAALAVAAVVTVVFVVLCPAHLTFSVARTGFHRPSGPTGTLQLSLTLAIDNPSRRAAVAYESMFVDVSNSTAVVWDNWVRAAVAPATPPLRQPRRGVATVAATVDLVGPLAVEFTGNMTSSSFAVMVTAQARFKVGVAWTRLYDIKVSCAPVSFFFPAAKATRQTGGGGAAAAGLPVKCV